MVEWNKLCDLEERKQECTWERASEWGELFLQMAEKRALRKVEALFAHYLVGNKIPWHSIHILSSANILVLLIILPAKQNQNTHISFHRPL